MSKQTIPTPSTNAYPALHYTKILDRIGINNLCVDCIIGVLPHERTTLQQLIITVILHAKLTQAAASDALEHTVDYAKLAQQIEQIAVNGQFQLIETLAEKIAAQLLQHPRVMKIDICIRKPAAIANADSASVAITRSKPIISQTTT